MTAEIIPFRPRQAGRTDALVREVVARVASAMRPGDKLVVPGLGIELEMDPTMPPNTIRAVSLVPGRRPDQLVTITNIGEPPCDGK